MALGTDAAAASRAKGAFDPENPFKYARKAHPSKMAQTLAEFQAAQPGESTRKALDVKPIQTLKNQESSSILDGPDGKSWYYSSSVEADTIYHPYGDGMNGGWNEINITGFNFTIYDSTRKEIGTIHGSVELHGDEAKVASIELGSVVTQKFFNSDDKYEVMVYTVRNYGQGQYGASLNTDVYSIGGAKDENGYDQCIMTIPGYCVAAENIKQDRFTENFYITFSEEYEPDPEQFTDPIEFANAYGMTLKTYKKGGWGLPTVIDEHFVARNNTPGDQDSYPPLFIVNGGKDKFGTYDVPMLVYVEYEKPYWVNPLGWNPDDPTSEEFDESPTADNNLLVTCHKLETVTGSTTTEVSTTRIPVVQREGFYATYFGIGALDWDRDIIFDDLSTKDALPSRFTVCTTDVLANSEDEMISFHTYGNDGTRINTIAEDVDASYVLSDLAGQPRQALFAVLQDNAFYYVVTDIETGEQRLAFPSQYEGYSLMFNVDRTLKNGKPYYVFSTKYAINDEYFNAIEQVIWINEDGEIADVQNYNLGQDVADAQCFINNAVLSPYLFDYDDENELMFIVKRYVGLGSTTQEELCVVGADNGVMLTIAPDGSDKGVLSNIAPVNLTTNPSLLIVWGNNATGIYTQEIYTLPLIRFQSGDGSVENPYEITNAAQLRLIGDEPGANYAIVKDLDATDIIHYPIVGFRGTLDGRGHAISNLTITPSTSSWTGLFNRVEGAKISNLTFISPSMQPTAQQSYAGILLGEGFNVKISNVHMYHPTLAADDKFDGHAGAVAGKITNGSSLSDIFVSGATISAPGSEDGATGGIAGTLQTGSTISSAVFSGALEGMAQVGGIAGYVDADAQVNDCHVDADIVAQNTVGGVAGFSKRGLISHNFVEGTVKATKADWWNEIICAGGVVGTLEGKYAVQGTDGTVETPDEPVVTSNIVALGSITVPEGTEATAHRIVGKTSAELGAEDDPDAAFEEIGLENNYSFDTLAAFDADKTGTTAAEGEAKDKYEIDIDFLTELGFKFGSTTAEPWTMHNMTPALYFESAITIAPAEMTVFVDETFFINVHVLSRVPVTEEELLGDFSGEWDESLFEMTGNYTFSDNVMAIEFSAIKSGEGTFTINMLGSSATCTVTAEDKNASVDNVTAAPETAISFNGSEVTCEGTTIEIYALNGLKVAAGQGAVSTTGLTPGIYVAVANGNTIKIAVK